MTGKNKKPVTFYCYIFSRIYSEILGNLLFSFLLVLLCSYVG